MIAYALPNDSPLHKLPPYCPKCLPGDVKIIDNLNGRVRQLESRCVHAEEAAAMWEGAWNSAKRKKMEYYLRVKEMEDELKQLKADNDKAASLARGRRWMT